MQIFAAQQSVCSKKPLDRTLGAGKKSGGAHCGNLCGLVHTGSDDGLNFVPRPVFSRRCRNP
jgi:hypothetical protein